MTALREREGEEGGGREGEGAGAGGRVLWGGMAAGWGVGKVWYTWYTSLSLAV